MRISRSCGVALAAVMVVSCGRLHRDEVDAAPVVVEPAPQVVAPLASASATPDASHPPRSDAGCVDARADVKKRAGAALVPVATFDFDGDGKADLMFSTEGAGTRKHYVYAMRGACGTFVGELSADKLSPLSARSHGFADLKTERLCAAGCGCAYEVYVCKYDGDYYTDGACAAQSSVDRPCDAGATADAAPPPPSPAPTDAAAPSTDGGPAPLPTMRTVPRRVFNGGGH